MKFFQNFMKFTENRGTSKAEDLFFFGKVEQNQPSRKSIENGTVLCRNFFAGYKTFYKRWVKETCLKGKRRTNS